MRLVYSSVLARLVAVPLLPKPRQLRQQRHASRSHPRRIYRTHCRGVRCRLYCLGHFSKPIFFREFVK